ncbi:putative bifunctional diguanylate cyclase/phosphodiesterase [Lentibacillus sp. Marseille-P4043]|uniref:putative bifunctional diguanylate cyclase/phosphodiesterase n=1 Tax=Lentibacillus sp. Marseille-P4043 TaxID=2040293 RepID=UPI000D0B1597|nr:EAL domain-containing protein [Lentibacillus sp. Marseille-P4043]
MLSPNEIKMNQIIYNGFMQSKEGMMIVNYDYQILTTNNALENMIGIDNNRIDLKYFLTSHFLGETLFTDLQHSLEGDGTWEDRVWLKQQNDTVLPLWLNVQSIIGNTEKHICYLFTFQPIPNYMKKRDKVGFLAFNDMLTQLPNRLSFENKVNNFLLQPRSKENMFALLFIDLDRFKLINDTFGHSHGDLLLQEAANRLKSCFPQKNTIARWGGDEFICLLPFSEEKNVVQTAKDIISRFSAPFILRESEIYVTVSIGISLYPHDGENLETLITQADSAMYVAKKTGRNNYAFSRAELHASNFEKLNLESMLRKALKEDQLVLYYQPQINIVTKELEAVEALVRWHHPEYGVIPPNEFIPIAEDSGLILDIDDWVLHTACRQLKTWETNQDKQIRVSINLSAQQFMQKGLPEKIATILSETELEPSLLEIEITETMVMQDTKMSALQIGKIRAMGVKIAIDDFGTGHSSFQYLKNFAVDSLKIDKIFIDDIESNQNTKAIMHSMIHLGHDLNLRVVAEGVETTEQLLKLQDQKCDVVQGYLFYKPMQTEKIDELLDEKKSATSC